MLMPNVKEMGQFNARLFRKACEEAGVPWNEGQGDTTIEGLSVDEYFKKYNVMGELKEKGEHKK